MYPYYNSQMPQNYLPAQQVIQVDGKQSAQNIKMAPNSSTIVADKNLPLIYMCMTDGLGNVSVSAYDITPHRETPPVDMKSLEDRLSEVEKAISRMEEKKNGKSNNTKHDDEPTSAG